MVVSLFFLLEISGDCLILFELNDGKLFFAMLENLTRYQYATLNVKGLVCRRAIRNRILVKSCENSN